MGAPKSAPTSPGPDSRGEVGARLGRGWARLGEVDRKDGNPRRICPRSEALPAKNNEFSAPGETANSCKHTRRVSTAGGRALMIGYCIRIAP